MKVLWIGDAVVQSGFSIVTHNICNELYRKCDLVVYGIRYDGRERHKYPYYIYPAQTPGDIYNFNYAVKVVEDEEPDIIVLFNDDHVIRRFLDAIVNKGVQTIPLFPVNLLPIKKDNMPAFSDPKFGITEVMSYTEFSKRKIEEINPNISVNAIYHGVDRKVFFPMKNAKKELNLQDYFVVGNVNINSYRKRLDLFLKGFAKFAKGKNDVRCLIHAAGSDRVYDLASIAQDLGIAGKVILSQSKISFEDMRLLYNTMDVNCSTCVGEGFGLSFIEGAACGIPILCPEHGNLVDIWQDKAEYIKIGYQDYIPGTNYIADVICIDDFADKLNKFYEDRKFTRMKGERVYEFSKDKKFDWKVVADKVFNIICRVNENKVNILASRNDRNII